MMVLGMPGSWAQHNQERSDHYTTKIGGLPDLGIPGKEINPELTKCGVCGRELALVAQVYAPLETGTLYIEDRTLYIFGCPHPNCGTSPLSWRTIRIQKRSSIGESSQVGTSTSNGNLEPSNRLSGEEEEHKDEWWEDETWTNGEAKALEMQELSRALMEAGYMVANPSTSQNAATHPVIEEAIKIESDLLHTNMPVLPCFYIYSENESHPSHGSRAGSALHTSENFQGRQYNDAKESGEETWEGEEYEHDKVFNVDRTYLKFKKRLDCYPEQCFRYCFGGQPLLANKDRGDPGVCSICQGPRVFEMQLMPPLLYYLQQACKESLSAYSAKNWEWLTLFVYTCAHSCSGDMGDSNEEKEWLAVEEATIIQYET